MEHATHLVMSALPGARADTCSAASYVLGFHASSGLAARAQQLHQPPKGQPYGSAAFGARSWIRCPSTCCNEKKTPRQAKFVTFAARALKHAHTRTLGHGD
eukprot:4016964-Amphidinium_carterae.1